MFRVAIVEDDLISIREFRAYFERYTKETGETFSIAEFHDGDAVLTKYKADYDMILMDINMPLLDGMTTAEQIRRSDAAVRIVFVTNMPQYAIRGYKVGALDYLLKPVSYFAFADVVRRAIESVAMDKKRYIIIQIKGGRQKLDVSRLLYAEVVDHDLIFHMKEGDIHGKGTIRQLEEDLAEESFFSCNKGILINLAHVDAFAGNNVFINGTKVPVSRLRKKELIDRLNRYLNTGL